MLRARRAFGRGGAWGAIAIPAVALGVACSSEGHYFDAPAHRVILAGRGGGSGTSAGHADGGASTGVTGGSAVQGTVELAKKRGLQVGRYKAVDDLLAHNVEAYTGMP